MRGRLGFSVLCSAVALGCGDVPVSAQGPRPSQALTLLHTADIHSRVWPFRSRISRFEAGLGLGQAQTLAEVGGAARLATLLDAERRRGAALWLDSGDVLEGAAVFHRFGGSLELELLSSLGLGAMALGNHELSLDVAALAELFSTSASFPVLAANLRPHGDSALFGRVLPSVVLDAGGVRVGVVGVANPTSPPNLGRADNPWRLELAPDLAVAVQAAVDDVAPRSALVIVLSHLGLDGDRELVRATTGIDLVLGGHQHIVTAEPEWEDDCFAAEIQARRRCAVRRVPIVHSGAYARWLSRLELTLVADPSAPAQLEVGAVLLTQLPVSQQIPADARVSEFLEARRPPPEPPLGFLPAPLRRRSALAGDSPLGNLTADAMLTATSADVALLNSSGLRADLEAGELLRSDLDLAFPFDEPWRLLWLTGRLLRQGLLRAAWRSAARDCDSTLQVAGLRLRIDCAACAARGADCLQIVRPSVTGSAAPADDEWLLAVLPVYLTLPGADFEGVGSTGVDVDATAQALLLRYLQKRPRLHDLEACQAALEGWSALRCREAFGTVDCPLDAVRARAACRLLPVVEGGRDGRIEMVP
jgi:5'-nucleotidase / UDP-sugar diphosphatase